MSLVASIAPRTLQKFMHEVARGPVNTYLYMDDIMFASHSQKQRSANLRSLFDLLGKSGATINTAQCELAKPNVKILRHSISSSDTALLPNKITAIHDWPDFYSHRQLR